MKGLTADQLRELNRLAIAPQDRFYTGTKIPKRFTHKALIKLGLAAIWGPESRQVKITPLGIRLLSRAGMWPTEG